MTEEQRLIAQIDAALWKDAWSEKTAALEACRKYLHSVTNACDNGASQVTTETVLSA
jgi:hypothetical protein